jgi:hypothetical protein
LPLVTITDWEPIELSFVSVGADPNAYIRNLKGKTMPQARKQTRVRPDHQRAAVAGDVLDRPIEGDDIDELEIETRGDDLGDDDNPAGDAPPAARRVMSDRHARQAYEMAARQGLEADWARRAIEGGVTLRAFRDAALDEAAARSDRTRINPRSGVGFVSDDSDSLGEAIGGALYARMTGRAATGQAVEWRGRSLLEMGAALLEARGERVSWASRERLAGQILARADMGGMHTTSDFPTLLQQSGNRVLLDAFKAAQTPLLLLAKRRDAVDFRPLSLVKLGEAPSLAEVLESGEVTYGTRAEAKESFRVKTFAKIFSLSRQAIINDDLGAFADTNTAWGRAAAETQANELVALLTANSGDGASLDDTNPLYSTARGNKAASGAAINVGTLGAGRKAMREFKGLDGKTPISVTPKHLVVGAAKETEAEQVLATLAAAQVAEQNPFGGKLALHVEPRLTGNAWRLFADPSELAVLQVAYLNGQDGPILEQRDGWTTLGAEFRAILDFGCGLAEWRGTYLNSGN